MVLLDNLLELKAEGTMMSYISGFNLAATRLQSMGIKFDEELLIALFLRGLPSQFEVFCSTVRNGESIPTLETIFVKLLAEEKVQSRRSQSNTQSYQATSAAQTSQRRRQRCTGCNRVTFHDESQCWTLHPELMPICTRCNQRGHSSNACRGTSTALAFLEDFPVTL
jgi:uncharacterized paraquat-inducible protein A